MYKITDNLEVGLNKVTPKALIGLKELKLYDTELEIGQDIRIILDIFIQEELLKKFLSIVFKEVKEYNFDDLDLSEVVRGYRDFFGQLRENTSS